MANTLNLDKNTQSLEINNRGIIHRAIEKGKGIEENRVIIPLSCLLEIRFTDEPLVSRDSLYDIYTRGIENFMLLELF